MYGVDVERLAKVFGTFPLMNKPRVVPQRGGPLCGRLVLRKEGRMTIFEWSIDYCKQRGMEERDAAVVMEKVFLHPATREIRDRWGDAYDSYPDPLKKLLVRTICECVLEWIKLEDPHAFYRPLFDGSVPN
jgi:hypothetical protein